MAKRFSDTDKWKKVWFRELKPIHKCFWEYIRDNCNNAGIWDVDFKLASFQIGARLNQGEIETVFEKQFIKVNDNKWFLTDFIEWQYNCSIDSLNPKNNAHLSAIRILNKFKIKELIEGLVRAQHAPKDKDKDKDKNKAKVKDKVINMDKDRYNIKDVNKRALFEKWLDYRTELKKPIIVIATVIALVKRFNTEKIEKIKWVINNSIQNGWQGLFWDKYKEENPQKPKREIIGYQYDCYHCGKSYKFKGSGAYRCTENECQIEMKGKEIVGAKLDLTKTLYKK